MGNRVHGWTQKALVGTFMGGLKSEISDGIRLFKPKTLKEAISLARMRDEQLLRQRRLTRPLSANEAPLALPSTARSPSASPVKKLSWDEMQKGRAQGLCFNCNNKFTPGHKCLGPRLLLLDGNSSAEIISCEDITEDSLEEQLADKQVEPEISLHALTG